jgi:arylsulfatase A-like enzyme
MTDDQGYGDLACHGNPIIKTPNLDALHSESVRFTNFHVNAFCSPTRASLLTGRMSDRTHVRTTIYARNHLNRDETTMAEFFKSSGYRTGHFGKWHLGRNYPYRPIDRGFDEWVGHGDGGIGTSSDYWGNDKMNDTYRRNGNWEKFSGFCTDIYFDESMKFIEKTKDKPFFVYLATNVPHSPWNVPKEWRKQYEAEGTLPDRTVDFYATISRFDHNLGRLRKFLADRKLDDNTIIVYLTDNGTSGGDKVFNAGMRGNKGSAYEGGHRVPCFIHWPNGRINKPVNIDRLTNHFDLLPTLIELCSLKVPTRGHLKFDGKSLTPLLKDSNADWPDRTVFMHIQNVREKPVKWMNSVVMTEQWRLIDGEELYDIKSDPGQKQNIADSRPKVVADLRQRYERHWNEIDLAANPYPRPIIGSRYEEETSLVPDGWIIDDEKGRQTWNQSHILSGADNSGFWPVEMAADGTYQFDVRRWPKELNLPVTAALEADSTSDIDLQGRPVQPGKGKAIPAVRVELLVGKESFQTKLNDGDVGAKFDVRLPAGPTDVRAWLIDAKGNKRGAYYIYARKTSAEQKKHLFILSGQSNMAGLNPEISFTPAVETAFGKDNVIVVKDDLHYSVEGYKTLGKHFADKAIALINKKQAQQEH